MIKFKEIFSYISIKEHSMEEIKAQRDWRLIIVAFVVLLIIISLLSFYIFLNQKSKVSSEIDLSNENVVTIDRALLNDVMAEINLREDKFIENLLSPKINDPSL